MKHFLITAAIALLFISCDYDETSPKSSLVLPKTTATFFSDDNLTISGKHDYDGNRLSRIMWDDGSYEAYTYENGRIKNVYYYYEDRELVTRKTFYYDGDKLARLVKEEIDEQIETVIKYTYNADTTVSIKEYYRDTEDDPEEMHELVSTGVLTIEAGNITQFVRTYTDGSMDTFNYSFDDKYNAYNNIVSADILRLAELEGGVNNYVSTSAVVPDGSSTATYANTYNDAGYITNAVGTFSDNSTWSTSTTY